jgi:hypothetical protein
VCGIETVFLEANRVTSLRPHMCTRSRVRHVLPRSPGRVNRGRSFNTEKSISSARSVMQSGSGVPQLGEQEGVTTSPSTSRPKPPSLERPVAGEAMYGPRQARRECGHQRGREVTGSGRQARRRRPAVPARSYRGPRLNTPRHAVLRWGRSGGGMPRPPSPRRRATPPRRL